MSSIRKVPEKAPLSVSESRTALTHASSSKWLFRCLVCFNLYHKPRRPRLALPPITQMRKLRHREVTALARGHTVRKWWRGGGTQDLFQVAMSGSLTPAPDNNDKHKVNNDNNNLFASEVRALIRGSWAVRLPSRHPKAHPSHAPRCSCHSAPNV